MVTRTCQTKRGVEMEIGSRRETVSDRLDPFWTGSADNQLPTKTADFALGTRGIPRSRRASELLAPLAGGRYENRGEHRAPPQNVGRARWVADTKEGDPSGIRIAAKQREPTREFVVSVGDARSETSENTRRYGGAGRAALASLVRATAPGAAGDDVVREPPPRPRYAGPLRGMLGSVAASAPETWRTRLRLRPATFSLAAQSVGDRPVSPIALVSAGSSTIQSCHSSVIVPGWRSSSSKRRRTA